MVFDMRKEYELKEKKSEQLCFADLILEYARECELSDIDYYVVDNDNNICFNETEVDSEYPTAILYDYHNIFKAELEYNGKDLFDIIRFDLFCIVYKYGNEYLKNDYDYDYDILCSNYAEYSELNKYNNSINDIFDYIVDCWAFCFNERSDNILYKIIEGRNIKLLSAKTNGVIFEFDLNSDNNDIFYNRLYIFDVFGYQIENMQLSELILDNALTQVFG